MIGPKRTPQTDREKREAYELADIRDRGACQMPAGVHGPHVGAVQRDHRQNRDDFNTVVENLHLLCMGHHKWKTEHPREAQEEGWGCSKYESPLAWPARRLIGGRLEWVLYLRVEDFEGEAADAGWAVISDVEAAALRAGLTAEQVL